MKKYFLIKSIRRDKQDGDKDGWMQYTITPVALCLEKIINWADEYNKDEKKTVSIEVYGVSGQETAVITVRGSRARVNSFPTALATTNFYEYFSLREVNSPDVYL